MSLTELASFIAVLLAAYATYRSSIRKAELERLNARVVDLEKRLADSEQRANDNEQKAIDYRQDVIKLGEQLERERHESIRRLGLVAADGNAKINKVVIILEKVLIDVEATTGNKPDVDLEALKRLAVSTATDKLGPIDVHAVKSYISSHE